MKKQFIFFLIPVAYGLVLLSSCSKDKDEDPLKILPEQSKNATIYQAIEIDPMMDTGTQSPTYEWNMNSSPSDLYSLTNAGSRKCTFLASSPGTYRLSLKASENGKILIQYISVTVKEATKKASPYISKVYDFLPAPGQFTNNIPEYADGNTKADMIAKAQEYIAGQKNGGLVSLGGFGGYIVFGFDHTIVNVKGKRDLRIMGNAFYANANPNPNAPKNGGSCEPGIVMVAYDANKNGKPDENEWYEIAGSEYDKPKTIKNYEISYFRPESEDPVYDGDDYVTIKNYIKWEDNQGNTGYKEKNMFHSQSYFPSWITDNKITFRGTLLPKNAIDESGSGTYWVLYAYGYGYADNVPNTENDSAIDIGWAVDSQGKKVELPGIDFVKVYTGVNQEAGWLGETSTEVAGAYDLHMEGESIAEKN